MTSVFDHRIDELRVSLVDFQEKCGDDFKEIAIALSETFINGGTLFICGNGGSAADSQHWAAEFVNAFSRKISRPALPAIALTTDSSVITAISNDFDFDNIFSRQLEALGSSQDIVFVLSTSGSSKNCINVIQKAREMGIKTVSLTSSEGQIAELSDLSIRVPSSNTQVIQSCHLLVYHMLTEFVENRMYGEK
jgi:D-sedoheptulose 7-phosphate isomerase